MHALQTYPVTTECLDGLTDKTRRFDDGALLAKAHNDKNICKNTRLQGLDT